MVYTILSETQVLLLMTPNLNGFLLLFRKQYKVAEKANKIKPMLNKIAEFVFYAIINLLHVELRIIPYSTHNILNMHVIRNYL